MLGDQDDDGILIHTRSRTCMSKACSLHSRNSMLSGCVHLPQWLEGWPGAPDGVGSIPTVSEFLFSVKKLLFENFASCMVLRKKTVLCSLKIKTRFRVIPLARTDYFKLGLYT